MEPTVSVRRRLLTWSLHGAIVISAMVWAVATLMRVGLPSSAEIHPQLLKGPVQTAIDRSEFLFHYRGGVYDVQPVAAYEISGLVVSHNNIKSLADIYHDEDSVDLKDICIIWGANLRNNDFQQVDFESNAWTCSYSYFGELRFQHNQVANNHLLAAEAAVQKTIRSLKIGDQVTLKGMLVNYRRGNTDYVRASSLSRDDTGNGACEVMFVEEVKVLAKGRPGWDVAYHLAIWSFWLLLVGRIILFFVFLYREHQEFERYEKNRLQRLEHHRQLRGY